MTRKTILNFFVFRDMKKKILIATIVSFLGFQFADLRAQEEQRQYVSWGFAMGPNISSYIMRVDPLLRDTLIADSMLSALPATGLSLGVFLDYHITDEWCLQANGTLSLEQATLRYADHHSHMLTLGADAGLSVFYRHPWRGGNAFVGFGPFFHFVLYSAGTEDINLYRRHLYNDPVDGKTHFAMSDIHAGLNLTLGYEFPSRWFLQMEGRFGVTDILNLSTPGTYVYPYKVVVGVGCRF